MSSEYKSVSDSMSEGGPAFPGKVLNTSFCGMTLRDYFAAKAMEQLIAKVPYGEYVSEGSIAIDAYDYADAMLERRNK